jgi:hypothetical protein
MKSYYAEYRISMKNLVAKEKECAKLQEELMKQRIQVLRLEQENKLLLGRMQQLGKELISNEGSNDFRMEAQKQNLFGSHKKANGESQISFELGDDFNLPVQVNHTQQHLFDSEMAVSDVQPWIWNSTESGKRKAPEESGRHEEWNEHDLSMKFPKNAIQSRSARKSVGARLSRDPSQVSWPERESVLFDNRVFAPEAFTQKPDIKPVNGNTVKPRSHGTSSPTTKPQNVATPKSAKAPNSSKKQSSVKKQVQEIHAPEPVVDTVTHRNSSIHDPSLPFYFSLNFGDPLDVYGDSVENQWYNARAGYYTPSEDGTHWCLLVTFDKWDKKYNEFLDLKYDLHRIKPATGRNNPFWHEIQDRADKKVWGTKAGLTKEELDTLLNHSKGDHMYIVRGQLTELNQVVIDTGASEDDKGTSQILFFNNEADKNDAANETNKEPSSNLTFEAKDARSDDNPIEHATQEESAEMLSDLDRIKSPVSTADDSK